MERILDFIKLKLLERRIIKDEIEELIREDQEEDWEWTEIQVG